MIYLFLAQGFEEIEATAPLDLLRRAKAEVRTVGVGSRRVTGSHGIEITADLLDKDLGRGGMEMIVLPGGMPGARNLEQSPVVRESLESCAGNGKKIAAICAAPSILGHMGLLRGHKAVCFPGYEDELGADEVLFTPTCVSGNIITARGAGVAVEFGLKLVEVLFGEQKAKEIGKNIQCV